MTLRIRRLLRDTDTLRRLAKQKLDNTHTMSIIVRGPVEDNRWRTDQFVLSADRESPLCQEHVDEQSSFGNARRQSQLFAHVTHIYGIRRRKVGDTRTSGSGDES